LLSPNENSTNFFKRWGIYSTATGSHIERGLLYNHIFPSGFGRTFIKSIIVCELRFLRLHKSFRKNVEQQSTQK